MRRTLLLTAAMLGLGAQLALAKHHHHHSATGPVDQSGAPADGADKFIGTLALKDGLVDTPMPAGPPPVPDSPAGDAATPAPPTMPDERSYVLLDGTTGAVLAEAAPHLPLPPASLAKLMTAHLTYQALHGGALKPDQTVPVSVDAWHAGGSRMYIDPTSVVTVDQLLHGLMIESGNDAATALAEQVSGTTDSFVTLMNKTAGTLGLNDTVYTNVTGLPDPAMHTSAMDVALLTRAILQNEPEILNITKLPSYTYDNITQATWNPMLAVDPTVDGIKTGLTKESGHCIDATAIRNHMRLIAVVMGGPNFPASVAAIESLLSYGEKFFSDAPLATASAPLDTLQSPQLESGSVAVGAGQSVTMTLPNDALPRLTHSIAYTTDLTPGVTKGEVLGSITYTLDGKALTTVPAVALADSPAASFFTTLQRKLSKML